MAQNMVEFSNGEMKSSYLGDEQKLSQKKQNSHHYKWYNTICLLAFVNSYLFSVLHFFKFQFTTF